MSIMLFFGYFFINCIAIFVGVLEDMPAVTLLAGLNVLYVITCYVIILFTEKKDHETILQKIQ